MPSDILILSVDKTENVPLIVGGTSSFTISVKNLSSDSKLYNLSLFLDLPDGMSIYSSTLPFTSTTTNVDGSSKYSWISLKDLAPMEVDFTFSITVKCANTFKNGTNIPFGYLFTGINVKCQADTKPRGDYDIGNLKITKEASMTFKTTRFLCSVSTAGKVLKGAGTSLALNDYTQVYSATCKFFNNSLTTSLVNISILLENGIRYLGNISVTGTDSSKFTSPTISTITFNNKQYTRLYYGAILLSQNSNTSVTFNYAVWNRYDNNLGDLISHGTKLEILVDMSSSDETTDSSTSFSAMDLIISTSVNKSPVDVTDNVIYSYTYSVGQYYDIQDITVNYFLPDGVSYLSTSVAPFSIEDSPILQGFNLIYKFPFAMKNSQNTVTINARIDSYYRYKFNSNNTPLPVVAFDNFKATTNIIGTKSIVLIDVTDSSGTSCSIKTATIKKEFLKGYYRNGAAKTYNVLAPGDLAEYKLTYDSTTLKAIQKQIYIDDFFPLSSDPIDNLTYNYTGYLPLFNNPNLIDPHGVDFDYGDIPGNSLSSTTFKVPIKLLGSPGQNINLMKLTGTNTAGYSYSNRDQVLINIGTPNIQLTKSVTGPNKTSIKSGEVYTYTLKISNTNTLGTETDAFDFLLNDTISSWFTVNANSFNVTGTGSFSNPTLDDTGIKLVINKLAPGQSITLSYTVTIINTMSPGVSIQTTATTTNPYSQQYIEGLDNFQYSNLNKTASVTISSASIGLTKTNNSSIFKVGSDIIYTITLTIPIGTIAYDVYVKDTLPNTLQIYSGSAFRNGVPITINVSNNILTFPTESIIDARTSVQVMTYTIYCKIINGTKTVGTITSTQTNNYQSIYKQKSDGSSITINKNLTVTINHPNIVLNLNCTDRSNSTQYTQTANITTDSILDFKLDFKNNSNIKLLNGIIEIPINNNFAFSSINTTLQCSAYYNNSTQKIIVNIPELNSSISGIISFTLVPISTLRSGTSVTLQATATQYYNDISTKLYGGEKSNIITCVLPPGTSLLPDPNNRVNDSTSYRTTIPGSTVTIINYFKNSGGGYDDYTLIIQPVNLFYTLYINDEKIADINNNTLYQADLNIMKNVEVLETRTIKIITTIPLSSPMGSRYDFIVTARSKTSPYPEKTVLNIDPSH